MKDNLEQFVRDHSNEFDLFEPDDSLWQGIEEKIEEKKPFRWKFYLSRAAAVAAIFAISFVVQRIIFSDTMPRYGEAKIDIPELREAELYYSGLINTKLQEVKPLLDEYPSLEEELTTDLTELDSIYTLLKEDLKEDVANQEVLEAMIQNYRLRIDILEDMVGFLVDQNEIDNINTSEYDL